MLNTPLIDSELPGDISRVERSLLLCRLSKAAQDFQRQTGCDPLQLSVRVHDAPTNEPSADGAPADKRREESPLGANSAVKAPASTEADAFVAVEPAFGWDRVVLAESTRMQICAAVEAIRQQQLLFDDWGLREIEPYPRAALNFYGPPGTGKTLTAHAVAQMLGRPILVASYAQIESKFLGDGPKNAARLFEAAEQAEAVLFIDEADSLLSRRLTGATQGAERAANSLTSQLLISLERFRGVVIFATNLLANYDQAFDSRVQHVEFPAPDRDLRTRLWKKHLPRRLPLASDVQVAELADQDSLSGRDIRNAVILAATRAVSSGRTDVNRELLLEAIASIRDARQARQQATGELTPEERRRLTERLRAS